MKERKVGKHTYSMHYFAEFWLISHVVNKNKAMHYGQGESGPLRWRLFIMRRCTILNRVFEQ